MAQDSGEGTFKIWRKDIELEMSYVKQLHVFYMSTSQIAINV